MRKIKYSAGMKAVAMLMQEIFSVILVVCMILVSALFDRSMLHPGDLKNREFTESRYYTEIFQGSVQEVLTYISYKKQFETDGVYNPEKAVNIMAYMDSNSQTSNNIRESLKGSERFRYYLVDLENWSMEYIPLSCQVESRLYVTEEDIHQVQEIYIDGEVVQESDTIIRKLSDMDLSLQKHIVTQVQYYYGGYYTVEELEIQNGAEENPTVFSEVKTDLNEAETTQQAASELKKEAEDTMPVEDAAAEDGPGNDHASPESGNGGASEDDSLLEKCKQKIIDGDLFELEGRSLLVVLKDLGLEEVSDHTQIGVLEEKYLTVDETTILGEFLSGSITLEEMERVYESLEYTLSAIGEEITAYKRLVNRYEKDRSNLQFWVYEEGTAQNYTNMKKINYEDFSEIGKAMGSYFYYSKNDIRLDSNVDGMEDLFYEKLESMNGGRSSLIFVGMDTTFPYDDLYKKAMEEYMQLQPWVSVALAAVLVSVFGCFLTFLYLSLAAGRKGDDGQVYLNRFDRIKTELLLVCFITVCIGAVTVFGRIMSLLKSSDLIGIMVMAGGMVFIIVAVFMVFYMSFVRRIKAGTMWEDSLACWAGRGVYKVVRNWNPSWKIMVGFTSHVVFTLILAVIALTWPQRKDVVFLVLAVYLLLCAAEALSFLRGGVQKNVLIRGIKKIAGGDLEYEIDTQALKGDNKVLGEAINTISEGLSRAVDDSMKNERLKADLITNVSHDIKTPLTSIINYVDLLKREDLDNDRAENYIAVLDAKSQRLKQLTEDLVEASKVSSGNITLQMDRLNLVELVYQTAGEFNERFEGRGLTAVTKLPKEPVVILADGRRIWRVLENLYNNVAKYAMENTRVYVDMEVLNQTACFSIKNISDQALNIDASELTERFIRGDVSRSTEGSGLGLSIAKSLTDLMGGTFEIYLDGDLFKVTVTFPVEAASAPKEEKAGK